MKSTITLYINYFLGLVIALTYFKQKLADVSVKELKNRSQKQNFSPIAKSNKERFFSLRFIHGDRNL